MGSEWDLSGICDRDIQPVLSQVHRQLMVALTIGFVAVRALLPAVSSFVAILCIIVSVEILGSPVTIMVGIPPCLMSGLGQSPAERGPITELLLTTN